MALKWIRHNIREFGGDPDLVTVFGINAGGHSVSLLSLSPLAKDLFQRAILQSGGSITPTSLWRASDAIQPREAAVQLAAKVGCFQQDSRHLLACLRSKSWQEIQKADPVSSKDTMERFIVLWKPRVDGASGFLPEDPTTMLSKGRFADVETMHGFCADETSTFISDVENDGVTLAEFKEGLYKALYSYNIHNKSEIILEAVATFLDKSDSPIELRSRLVDIISNFQMAAPIVHEVDTVVNSAVPSPFSNTVKKHFLYRFSYSGNLFPNFPAWVGVPHGLDVPFVFGLSPELPKYWAADYKLTPEDQKVANLVVDLWSNFAKYGDPTPQYPVQDEVSWLPFRPGQKALLNINEKPSMQLLNWMDQETVFRLMNQQLF